MSTAYCAVQRPSLHASLKASLPRLPHYLAVVFCLPILPQVEMPDLEAGVAAAWEADVFVGVHGALPAQARLVKQKRQHCAHRKWEGRHTPSHLCLCPFCTCACAPPRRRQHG